MLQCPDCKSDSVQSKGYRTKGVHRYLCNNCGRNFTIDHREKNKVILLEKIAEEVKAIDDDVLVTEKPKNINIVISREIHTWLTELKSIPQEPLNSVLMRIKQKEILK